MGNILLVEDEAVIRQSIARLLRRHHHSVSEADSVESALSIFDPETFDLILTDLRLPGEGGTALIAPAGKIPVLVMTSYASLKSAIEAMKQGAADYIAKPFNHDEMVALVNQHLKNTATPSGNSSAPPVQAQQPIVIGQSSAMNQLLETIRQVAPTHTNVVIIGQTGTGKALTARLTHALSARKGRMVSIDCGIMSPQTAQEQLFGLWEPGADQPHGSLILAAQGGTLVFEEIGELDGSVQSMILRMLASRTLIPLGATAPIPIDVRLIVTSQQPLKQLCEEGKLRADLYYRLDGIPLVLPPLSLRQGDIELLAKHFLSGYAEQLKKPHLHLTEESLNFLNQYPWPGNVRELKQCIERGAVLSQSGAITPNLLFPEASTNPSNLEHLLSGVGQDWERQLSGHAPSLEAYFQRFVLDNEQHMTETQMAQKLGISRKTLWERRQKLGIPRKRKLSPQQEE